MNIKHFLKMTTILITIILFWIWALFIVDARAEVTMTATVEESEMRACIESCGYEFPVKQELGNYKKV